MKIIVLLSLIVSSYAGVVHQKPIAYSHHVHGAAIRNVENISVTKTITPVITKTTTHQTHSEPAISVGQVQGYTQSAAGHDKVTPVTFNTQYTSHHNPTVGVNGPVTYAEHGHNHVQYAQHAPVAHAKVVQYAPVAQAQEVQYAQVAQPQEVQYTQVAHNKEVQYAAQYPPVAHNQEVQYAQVAQYAPVAHAHPAQYAQVAYAHPAQYAQVAQYAQYAPAVHAQTAVFSHGGIAHQGYSQVIAMPSYIGAYSQYQPIVSASHHHGLFYNQGFHDHSDIQSVYAAHY